jgi:hypothetical protein
MKELYPHEDAPLLKVLTRVGTSGKPNKKTYSDLDFYIQSKLFQTHRKLEK